MRHRFLFALPSLLAFAACGTGSSEPAVVRDAPTSHCKDGLLQSNDGSCVAAPTSTFLRHEFPEQVIEPGAEVLDNCRSWTLHNDEPLFVNAVYFEQNEASHHANFVFVPDTDFDGPDGFWPCSSRSYDFYVASTKGGILYPQSTQAMVELQAFAKGSAVRIPPHARIISDSHLVNTTTSTIAGHAAISLYTLPEAEVTSRLSAFHVEYMDLHIAPHQRSRFTSTCELAPTLTAATGKPFAPRLHFTLPHTHYLGRRVYLEILGGPNDGRRIFDMGGYDGTAHGQMYDPPIELAGATGFRYGCEYENAGDAEVKWGFAEGEMCEIFGFVDEAPFFWASAWQGSDVGKDGAVEVWSSPCEAGVGSE